MSDVCQSDGLYSSNPIDFSNNPLANEITAEIDRLYIAKFKSKVVYTFHKLLQSDSYAKCYDDDSDNLRFQTNKLIDKLLKEFFSASYGFQTWIILQLIRMAKQEDLILPSDPPGDIVKVLSHIILFYSIPNEVLELTIEAISNMDSKYLIAIVRNIRLYLKDKRDLWIDCNISFSNVYHQILAIMMKLPLPTLKSKRFREKSASINDMDVSDRKKVIIYRKVYQDCWVLIFQRSDRIDLSQDMIKMILKHLPEAVLPYLTNPFVIADTLLSSFYIIDDVECNVLSLISLFYIATSGNISVEESNLYEAKGFYSRLYDVTTKLLHVECMANGFHGKILQLIRECVSSGMIPGIYAIKFVKKLVQLACLAPSHLAISLLALAYSLFHRHIDSCRPLVHTQPHIAKLVQLRYNDTEKGESIDSPFSNNYSVTHVIPNDLCECLITDGLDDFKPIPCLWELDLLSRHVDKNVATLAESFVVDKLPKKLFNPFLFCDPLFSLRKALMTEINTLDMGVKIGKGGKGGKFDRGVKRVNKRRSMYIKRVGEVGKISNFS